jgi:hypothetical protein
MARFEQAVYQKSLGAIESADINAMHRHDQVRMRNTADCPTYSVNLNTMEGEWNFLRILVLASRRNQSNL